MFAPKQFQTGDRVMEERALLTFPTQKVAEKAVEPVNALLPVGGSLLEKFRINGIGCSSPDEDPDEDNSMVGCLC